MRRWVRSLWLQVSASHVCWILDRDWLAHHLWCHKSCLYTRLLTSYFQWVHRQLAFSVMNVKKIHILHCIQWNSNNWMNNKENICDWRRKNWTNYICELMFLLFVLMPFSHRGTLQWLTLLASFLHFALAKRPKAWVSEGATGHTREQSDITACWAHTLWVLKLFL